MPAVSSSQLRYAGMIASGKVNASDKTRAWASELLSKSKGMSMSSLPDHATSEHGGGNYTALNRSKLRIPKPPKLSGIKSYGG